MRLHHFLFLLSLGSLASAPVIAEDTSPQKPLVRPAKLLQITDPAIQSLRTFPAEVKASSRTELAFRVSGVLTHLHPKEGQEVKKGQLLAQLDPTDYNVSLQRYQAEYKLAKQQFERSKVMLERKLLSQAQFDQKEAELNIARAALNQARLNREYTELRAPYDGVVSQRLVENFQNIQAKQPVLILQSDDQLDIELQIPEQIISLQTRPNALKVLSDVRLEAFPDQVFKAQYRERSGEADPATGAYRVTLSLQKPAGLHLFPGMSASVTVDMNKVFVLEERVFTLPVEAVIAAEDQPLDSPKRQIWKVDPETMQVHRANVEVGSITSRGLEIRSGLEVGDTVVVAGANFLREGMQIRPWKRERGL